MSLTELADGIIAQEAELQRLQRKCYLLEPIAKAADELERWLSEEKLFQCMAAAMPSTVYNEMLSELLTQLSEQLKPYRKQD